MIINLKSGDDFLKESEKEKYSFLTKVINFLAAILLFIAIFYIILGSQESYVSTLLALIAFTILSIPDILKKKIRGWIFGILGLILIILILI